MTVSLVFGLGIGAVTYLHSSSFFFRYSDRNQQVDYSVAFEREVGTEKKTKKTKKPTYVIGLEALDTKVSMVVASTVVWGR